MLYLPPGTSRVQRVHAPFVTEKEISAVTEFWKAQGEAEYVHGFLEGPKDEAGKEIDGNGETSQEDDDLFVDAVRLDLRVRQGLNIAARSGVCASATAAPPTSST